jgi:hypothetical protein
MADGDEEQQKADPGSLDQDGDRGWTALCHSAQALAPEETP